MIESEVEALGRAHDCSPAALGTASWTRAPPITATCCSRPPAGMALRHYVIIGLR